MFYVRNMFLKVIVLFAYVALIETAFEGDRCVKDGAVGVCIKLHDCRTAHQDIKNRRNPQICSFAGAEPIVCCLDGSTGAISQSPASEPPSTRRPPSQDRNVPPASDEGDNNEDECEDLPPSITSKKTGQKAFDKCIEYQEAYIYPCEKGVSLLGDVGRSNNCHHNVDELIIGGIDAAQYEFPHMVMLGYGDNEAKLEWLCGGAVMSDRFILTAGHCIGSREGDPVSHVLVGALRRSEAADKSKIYKVKNIIKHPNYRAPIKYNDIALIEIDKPIKLNQFTVPACLNTDDDVDDERVLVAGWGLTEFRGNVSETLKKVIINKFSTSECSQKYEPTRLLKEGLQEETQLCYGGKLVSKDTCLGDSGGPIQIKSKKIQCMYTVVGVTSFGKTCGFVGEPGIYTRLKPFVSWIESIVWPN